MPPKRNGVPVDELYHRDHFKVVLRFAPPAWCLVNGRPSSWNMMPDHDHHGPFAEAVGWALDRLDRDGNDEPGEELELSRSRHEDDRAELEHACQIVTSQAVLLCAPHERTIALQFHDQARMFVYAALLEGDFKRILQMVDACPGLLILASATANVSVFRGVQEGQALASLIRVALLGLPVSVSTAAVLVRRAPSAVWPEWLIGAIISAGGIDINDMPSERNQRVLWYRWIFEWSRGAARMRDCERRRQFGQFVSRRALELESCCDLQGTERADLLSEIIDWVVADEGTVPSRDSSPSRILRAVRAWRYNLWATSGLAADLQLPPAPTAQVLVPGITAVPFATVRELVSEGQSMRHCVGSYARLAVEGRLFVYRATIRHQQVTVAVAPRGDRWRLVESAGYANCRVMEPGLLRRWVASLGLARPRSHRTLDTD